MSTDQITVLLILVLAPILITYVWRAIWIRVNAKQRMRQAELDINSKQKWIKHEWAIKAVERYREDYALAAHDYLNAWSWPASDLRKHRGENARLRRVVDEHQREKITRDYEKALKDYQRMLEGK